MGRKKDTSVRAHTTIRLDQNDIEAAKEIRELEGHKNMSETHRMIYKLGIFYYTMKQAKISVD